MNNRSVFWFFIQLCSYLDKHRYIDQIFLGSIFPWDTGISFQNTLLGMCLVSVEYGPDNDNVYLHEDAGPDSEGHDFDAQTDKSDPNLLRALTAPNPQHDVELLCPEQDFKRLRARAREMEKG